MLKKHLWGILNAVVLKVNNAKSEGINFKIQKLKQRACGYRNRERFRNAIYFHLGGIEIIREARSSITENGEICEKRT